MSASDDVRALLTEQHQVMAGKRRDVFAARGADRQSGFDDYRRYLAAHQGAEQTWMYTGSGFGRVADVAEIQLQGQGGAARLIGQLERVGIDSVEFDVLFDQLTTHSEERASGEREQLAVLMADATDGETDLMLRALRTVPTMAASHGYSITRADPLNFADLLHHAKEDFAAMPRTDPASTSAPQPDNPLT